MRKNLYTILFLATVLPALGQRTIYHKAEKHLQEFEFAAAAKSFEKIVIQNPSDVHALEGLVLCYDKLNDPQQRAVWLSRLCRRPEAPNQYFLAYAKVLATDGNYRESAMWYKKYIEKKTDVYASNMITQYNSINSLYEDSSYYEINKLVINTDRSDFSPAFFEDGIVFCSSAAGNAAQSRGKRDKDSFVDLYWAKDPAWVRMPFGKRINSPFHEGPSTLTSKFDTLFFTRNNSSGNHHRAGRDGIVRLNILYSIRVDGTWQKAQRLPINNDNYSTGHPALSGDYLYFASDQPGGFGGTDIYLTKLTNGSWSTPQNLGADINTPGNEMFPFISEDGDLYFASDTHPGLGGLDIFHCKKGQGFSPPRNMGYPVNSSKDDFGLILRESKGFFTSNRGVNPKDDNIYSLTIDKVKTLFMVAVSRDGYPLKEFDLAVSTDGSPAVKHTVSIFSTGFNADRKYLIECSKDGYDKQRMTFDSGDLKKFSDNDTVRFVLTPTIKNIRVALRSADGRKLGGGTVAIRNLTTGEIQTMTADASGEVIVAMSIQGPYELTGSQSQYKSRTVNLTSADLTKTKDGETIPLTLSISATLFEKNEVGQIIELDIRYDVGKSTIRKDAARELDKLVSFLKKNGTIKVELGSHTDIRGSEDTNHRLSQKRAEAVVLYIVAKGISSKRLVPIGYGESDPKVKNAVTEEDHQQNRRTTVKIVSI